MNAETDAITKNQTWDLVELPLNKLVVNCKWVYKVKKGVDGKIGKFNARLVAKGYTQTVGINFDETFSLVAKLNTVRTMIALTTQNN